MADILTQLQDAADQLVTQMVQTLHYLNERHDFQTLGPGDVVRVDKKSESNPEQQKEAEPHTAEVFKAKQKELARDLIFQEQKIEFLVSLLPGLENSEKDQEEMIQQLEVELKEAEVRRKEALEEKKVVLARLESAIRSVKRP